MEQLKRAMEGKITTDKPLMIAGRPFRSRLLMGAGKFSSLEVMKRAIEASGAEIVSNKELHNSSGTQLDSMLHRRPQNAGVQLSAEVPHAIFSTYEE